MLTSHSSYKPHKRRRVFMALLSLVFLTFLIFLHLLFNKSTSPSILEPIVLIALTALFTTNIIRRKKRQTTEAPENPLLQSILDNTASLIFIKDLQGKYIVANRRFLQVMSLTENEVIGHTDHDFNDPAAAAHYQELDDQVLDTNQPIEVEEQIGTAQGRRNLLLVKFPLRDANNKIFGIGGIATDITDRAHYQQELIRARREAEETRQLQEQFLANMSHEIRTPMNGIQGMTNLLLDTPLNAQQKEFADIISRSMQNLLVIVNDILDFSRIKAGKLVLEKIDFSLRDVLDNIEGVMGQRIRKKGLAFRIDIDPDIMPVLRGDPYRLNQVLLNLIGNALKFTQQGHIHVDVIQRDRSDNQSTILFRVSDTGSGISEENQNLIFDSFSQAGLDVARRHGGTGLGLAIVNQLLRMQQGGITVHSRPGEGATFECWLPFEYGDASVDARPHNPLDHSSALKDKHILVAEDNEINQKLIEFVLKKAGARPTIASNGQEAVYELEKAPYDILIMDLQMPVMDGYEATRYIREELKNPIPIIAMTATALKGEHLRCLETGMNDYMTKPFEFADLYRTVSDQLGRRSLTNTNAPKSPTPAKQTDRLYDLSLLQEMDDNDYLLEMLETFLTNTPPQLRELKHAADIGDIDTVYYVAHKLKGSVSMFRAISFQELLATIESKAKDRQPTTDLITNAATLYKDLETQLQSEKDTLYENSDRGR